jgi:hypothetical protein
LSGFLPRFLWGKHGWLSCASLWLILFPQAPGNHFDSRIFGWSSSFWWCSKDPWFPAIYKVSRQNFRGIASLVDAYRVPKLLSQQLLPFGRSGDELGDLTLGVEQFLPLSVRRGQSARRWRTVRESSVRRVFFMFLLGFAFDPCWFWVLVGRSFRRSQQRCGESAGAWRTIRVLPADGPFFGVHYLRFCWL